MWREKYSKHGNWSLLRTQRWTPWNVRVRNKPRNMNDNCFISWVNCSPFHYESHCILIYFGVRFPPFSAYFHLLWNNGILPDHLPVYIPTFSSLEWTERLLTNFDPKATPWNVARTRPSDDKATLAPLTVSCRTVRTSEEHALPRRM